MSLALIEAVKKGDLKAVELELTKPGVDININVSKDPYYVETPLLLAFKNKYWPIAKLLILRDARLEKENCEHYARGNEYRNYPYIYACTDMVSNPDKIDFEIFKLMITRVKVINPLHSGWDGHEIPSLTHLAKKHKRADFSDICVHEAFVRGDFKLLIEFSKLFNLPLSSESLRNYLKDRQLSLRQIQTMRNTITHLQETNCIVAIAVKDLSECVEELISEGGLTTECFPKQLQQTLKNDGRTLHEIFAEFQSIIYPEENLPLVALGGVSFEFFKDQTANCDREKVLRMQNPVVLRTFLESDEITLLMRFTNADVEKGEYHAAHLLANIIMWHSNTLITVKNKSEPLLNKEQIKNGISAINALYGLTRTEKLLMQTSHRQKMQLREVSSQNEELKETVDEMSKQLLKMEKMLSLVLDKLSPGADLAASSTMKPQT